MPSGLDARHLRYMSRNDFRVLVAVEMGMRNHEFVPVPLVEHIASLKRGGAYHVLRNLLQSKLVAHESVPCDSYRLTSMGYDYLALHALVSRGSLAAVGHRMGVGKESDIHLATDDAGRDLVVKMHRLGRTCFRAVRNKRDYLRPGQHATWLYLSRLSALKEFAFMKALHMHGFPIPEPVDVNRHTIVMGLARGYPLNQVQRMANPGKVYQRLIELYLRLASYGLVHCDFNEFNILIDDEEQVTMIDFPQMVSTDHPRAAEYFDRDIRSVRDFFQRRFGFVAKHTPTLAEDAPRAFNLDAEVEASGWSRQHEDELERCDDAIDGEGAAFKPSFALPGDEDAGDVRRGGPSAPLVRVALQVNRAPADGDASATSRAVECRIAVVDESRRGSAGLGHTGPVISAAASEASEAVLGLEHFHGERASDDESNMDASTVASVMTAQRQAAIARRVRQEHSRTASRQALQSAKQGNRSRKTSKKKADGNAQARAAAAAGSGW